MGKGINHELPKNESLKQRAKELRKAGNLSEVLLWLQLKKGGFCGLDFDRQFIIGNYIVDFFCAEKKLVIEIDGESHKFKSEYDATRINYLESLGLKIVKIADKDVKKNIEGVLDYIKSFI